MFLQSILFLHSFYLVSLFKVLFKFWLVNMHCNITFGCTTYWFNTSLQHGLLIMTGAPLNPLHLLYTCPIHFPSGNHLFSVGKSLFLSLLLSLFFLPCATTWLEVESFMLSKGVSQRKTTNMISLIHGI